MKHLAKLLTVAVLCSSLIAALPARADREDFEGEHHWRHDDHARWRMGDADRAHLHDWAMRDHDRFCRMHGCDRHAAYYAPGSYWPSGVYYEPLPSSVMVAPAGYMYVQAASGVYLMDRNTHLVADSLSLNINLR